MKAFHGDPKIKAKYLERIKAHEKADEIIHGQYWENGKGCAVGCTIHSSSHCKYENELGIPESLALLEDKLFEGMPNGNAKAFPRKFISAIKVGADLSDVDRKFRVWLLDRNIAAQKQNLKNVRNLEIPNELKETVLGSIEGVIAASLQVRIVIAAWSAESAARSAAAYHAMSDKLLALLRAAA